MRTLESARCEAHHRLARVCTKRLMLTGTPVVNKPLDLAGMCKAGDAPRTPIDFQDCRSWCAPGDKSQRTVNRETVRIFREHFVHRATDKILNLPPVVREAVNFCVDLPSDCAAKYNDLISKARLIRAGIEGSGKTNVQEMQRLMNLMSQCQQMVVHPLLQERSAASFKSEPSLIEQAIQEPTGAMHALRNELVVLQNEGHSRIVVACNHVVPMRIVKRWFDASYAADFGAVYTYDGEQTQKQRVESKRGFLQSAKSLLFLSIAAGGVGLHLVPGCEAMIFWGSMPFSPAHVDQCLKRIHRIGQSAPVTGAVQIRHLVPYGSVDFAIGRVHGDKSKLINFVQDGDEAGFDGANDSQWRKTLRIVEMAQLLDVPAPDSSDSGMANFAEMPAFDEEDGTGTPSGNLGAFTLLPGVKTRGLGELQGDIDPGKLLEEHAKYNPYTGDEFQKLRRETLLPSNPEAGPSTSNAAVAMADEFLTYGWNPDVGKLKRDEEEEEEEEEEGHEGIWKKKQKKQRSAAALRCIALE